MRITVSLLAVSLLAATGVKAYTGTDTLSFIAKAKFLKSVRIGPEAYLLPALPPKVDSALLFRTAVDESYRNRKLQDVTVLFHSNLQKLSRQLAPLPVYSKAGSISIENLETLLKSAEYSSDIKMQFLVLNTLAGEFITKGNLAKAAASLRQSSILAEKAGGKSSTSLILNLLSEIARLNGNYDEAVNYQLVLRAAANAPGQHLAAVSAYLSIATIRVLQKEYDVAEMMIIRQALPMCRGNKQARLNCFTLLSDLYFTQNRYSESKWYTLQAKLIADQQSMTEPQINCLSRLAAIKSAEGDRDNALSDLRTAESLAAKANLTDRLISIKGDIGDIYLRMGNYIVASNLLKEYSALSRSYLGTAQ